MATPPDGVVAIDECLSIRDGHLWVEGCDAVELARTFGTPIHVLSEDHLRRNVRRTVAAFRAAWPEGDVLLLPSIKANFTLAVRRILTDEGTGCDTFGPGELEAALRTGVPPETISVNGSVKSADLIERAVASGVPDHAGQRTRGRPGPQRGPCRPGVERSCGSACGPTTTGSTR